MYVYIYYTKNISFKWINAEDDLRIFFFVLSSDVLDKFQLKDTSLLIKRLILIRIDMIKRKYAREAH